jgi:hypothetical protein
MQNDLVEIVARATCQWDGTDPDEIMPDGKPRWCDRIDSVTFLFGPALQSAGYAVVPVEPTEAMLSVGAESYGDPFYFKMDDARECYTAMIQAARGGA